MAKRKPETDAGKMFAEETKGLTRSLTAGAAARKAAATRSAKGVAERLAYYRDHFVVTNHYVKVMASPCSRQSLTDLVAELAGGFGADPDCMGETLGDEDLAVWHDGRLVASVRRGADGKAVATIFDA